MNGMRQGAGGRTRPARGADAEPTSDRTSNDEEAEPFNDVRSYDIHEVHTYEKEMGIYESIWTLIRAVQSSRGVDSISIDRSL